MSTRADRTLLGVLVLAFFTVMAARVAISPVVPTITAYFSVSTGAVGIVLTAMWVGYALCQYPGGVLGDIYGERRIILAGFTLVVTGGVLLVVSPSFLLFGAFATLLGASTGLYYTPAVTLLTKELENTGRAIGIHGAGGPLGGLVVPPVIVLLLTRFGWRTALLVGPVVALVTLVLVWRRVPRSVGADGGGSLHDRFHPWMLGELLARPSIAFTTALAAMGWFGFQTTISFLPTFLAEYRGIEIGTASLLFSVYFVVLGTSMFLIGDVSEVVGRDPATLGVLLSGVLGYGLLVVGGGFSTLVAGVLLVGVAMSWPVPVEARLMDRFGDAERGTAFGLVRTVYMLFGACGSAATGLIADAAGWAAAFGLLVGMVAAMSAMLAGNRALGSPL